MTLDPGYLTYPRRRRGMDHDLYGWSNLFDRPPVVWPGSKRVAIWIVVHLEWFPITPVDFPFRAPGHMATPYPDLRHYTARDYGNRIGIYRLLDAFAAHHVTASFAVNAAIVRRYPDLLRSITDAGHEIVAHSTDMNGTIASGLDEGAEAALIADTLDGLAAVTGVRPRGWLSIARSQSWNTPRLLVSAGVDYMADWVNDDLPFTVATSAGEIVNIPLNHELGDRQILTVQQQSSDSYAEQIRDAFELLAGEAATFGGRMLPLSITPYISGLPHRIAAFDALLGWLAAQSGGWFADGGAILDAWNHAA